MHIPMRKPSLLSDRNKRNNLALPTVRTNAITNYCKAIKNTVLYGIALRSYRLRDQLSNVEQQS